MPRKKKTTPTSNQVPSSGDKPLVLRDEKGRLLPGYTSNPGGLSKHGREIKEMAAHVLMNKGWDVWYERLNDPKTPAMVIHAMLEWLYAVVNGRPGVRKDEAGPSMEELAKLAPTIVFSRADDLRKLGYDVKTPPNNGEEKDK